MKKPTPLRDLMARKVSIGNKYDSPSFRNSLKEGKNGNWTTKRGEIFVDGTYDPKSGIKQESTVTKRKNPGSALTDTARMYSKFKVPSKVSGLFGKSK